MTWSPGASKRVHGQEDGLLRAQRRAPARQRPRRTETRSRPVARAGPATRCTRAASSASAAAFRHRSSPAARPGPVPGNRRRKGGSEPRTRTGGEKALECEGRWVHANDCNPVSTPTSDSKGPRSAAVLYPSQVFVGATLITLGLLLDPILRDLHIPLAKAGLLSFGFFLGRVAACCCSTSPSPRPHQDDNGHVRPGPDAGARQPADCWGSGCGHFPWRSSSPAWPA